jgi:hypothetical protein
LRGATVISNMGTITFRNLIAAMVLSDVDSDIRIHRELTVGAQIQEGSESVFVTATSVVRIGPKLDNRLVSNGL